MTIVVPASGGRDIDLEIESENRVTPPPSRPWPGPVPWIYQAPGKPDNLANTDHSCPRPHEAISRARLSPFKSHVMTWFRVTRSVLWRDRRGETLTSGVGREPGENLLLHICAYESKTALTQSKPRRVSRAKPRQVSRTNRPIVLDHTN